MGKPAVTYKTELNSSHSLVGSRSTSPTWTTFYDNLRITYAILMKICPSAQNVFTDVLKLKCPLSWPLRMHNRSIFLRWSEHLKLVSSIFWKCKMHQVQKPRWSCNYKFTCISTTRKRKIFAAMFHTSLHLVLEAKQGQ